SARLDHDVRAKPLYFFDCLGGGRDPRLIAIDFTRYRDAHSRLLHGMVRTRGRWRRDQSRPRARICYDVAASAKRPITTVTTPAAPEPLARPWIAAIVAITKMPKATSQ